MLRVEGLCAGYGDVPVLDGVDLEVAAGETVVLVGPNGHGKTTVVRSVSGLIRPTAGRVLLDGTDITGRRPEQIAALGVRHVPQGDLVFPDMTVRENLLMGGFLCRSRKEREQRLGSVLETFPALAERQPQRCRTLSGGERRMLAIGRGLMADGRLLVLDEPSLGLAPVIVADLYARIAEIAESGVTLLLVEENFEHVQDIADRVYLIETGTVVRHGDVGELMRDPTVRATFLGGTEGSD